MDNQKLKYVKGKVIQSLDELSVQEFAIYNDKAYHVGWFMGWTLNFASNRIKNGQLFQAIKIPVTPK
jgi:hypothetical protein